MVKRKRIRLTGDEKILFDKLKNTMSKAKAKEFRYDIRDYRNFIREANKKIKKDKFYNNISRGYRMNTKTIDNYAIFKERLSRVQTFVSTSKEDFINRYKDNLVKNLDTIFNVDYSDIINNLTDEQFAELFNDFGVLYTLFTPSPKVGDIRTTFSLLFEKKEDFEEVLKSYAQG
jgi:hypothetical protein